MAQGTLLSVMLCNGWVGSVGVNVCEVALVVSEALQPCGL